MDQKARLMEKSLADGRSARAGASHLETRVHEWTDRNLAARCARGEAPAWRELVARHDRRILLVLGRALGRGGEAELLDLRQEVYARLLARDGTALRTLRAERPGALATFLARVALRVALDHARARGPRLHASAGETVWRGRPP